jgi:ABC-2 type transport system ATP-binding protein
MNTNELLSGLAANVGHSPSQRLGPGVLILAVLVLVGLGYGGARLNRWARQRRAVSKPEPPWSATETATTGAPPSPSSRTPVSPQSSPIVPPTKDHPSSEPPTALSSSEPAGGYPSFEPAMGFSSSQSLTGLPSSQPPKGGWAVETHGLTKRFGATVAVDGVELLVPRGSAFGYLGPNGAGKTTLIRTLLGLTKADGGTMSLLGVRVPAERSRALARVGAIVDEPRFHPHLTGQDNLRLLAAARGGDAEHRIAPSLARVGLTERADDKVAAYSMGMRQRLGVAACLLGDPELLILDEPMNGLDPAGMHEMRAMITSLVGEGRTVMLSSHLLDEVERTCDAVAIVDHGRVIRQGPIDELIRSAGAAVVQVDCAEPARAAQLIDQAGIAAGTALTENGLTVTLPAGASRELIADINRRLVRADIDVYGLHEARASLEDWFLSVTSRLGDPS